MNKNNPARGIPPLNALRVFEVVERHLNFRLAADELGVTHGAVAQQIRGLEEHLQIRLFNRLPRGLSLTEQGRTFISPIRRAMNLISEATNTLQPEKTVVSISLTPSFAAKWFMPRLAKFTEQHPDLEVKLSASEELSNFQNDGVDLSVRQGKPPFDPNMRAELLYAIKSKVVCSPEQLSKTAPLQNISDLKNHVLLHDAHSLWPLFLAQFPNSSSINAYKSLKFNQTSLAIDAAIAGQGVALVSSVLIEDDIKSGRLCQPLDLALDGDQGYYVLTPKYSRNPEAVSRITDWLLAQSQTKK
ncbi:LysR family transcriptional regulator [Alphaproteobacteria bacterium 46_93_T64]|nr:LysR family transcriptional regulator [Alphaproteobacteria bacterium 46_93_T64]